MVRSSAQHAARGVLLAGVFVGVGTLVYLLGCAPGHVPTAAVGCVVPAAFVMWGLTGASRPVLAWVTVGFGIVVAAGACVLWYLLVTREDPHYPTREVHVRVVRLVLLTGLVYGGFVVASGLAWARATSRRPSPS